MWKKPFAISFLIFFLGGSAVPGFAERQTGSIFGTVTDKDKNPLPGAMVEIEGPAVMGKRSYVTSETGIFRFAALPPGPYDIRIEMPGFKTLNQRGIFVRVGRTSRADIVLEESSIEEEITVVTESPGVDVLSSRMGVNHSSAFLSSIPLNRNLGDIRNIAPGAVAGAAGESRSSAILGGTVRGQLYALDGLPLNDPATNEAMAEINPDILEEIEFELGAHPAEVGPVESTYINIVTKSGGNSLSGGLNYYYTGESLTQNLFSAEQIKAMNVNPPENYADFKDVSLSLGGPVVKDKIWVFLNGRRQVWEQANPYAPENRMKALGFTDEGKIGHYDISHEDGMAFGKLTLQASKSVRYTGLLHYNQIYEPVDRNSIGPDTPYERLRARDRENTAATTHQFNVFLDQNTFLDLRGGFIRRAIPLRSMTPDDYTYYDSAQKITWGSADYSDEQIRKKTVGSASITRFQDGFLGANHEFKAGAEFERSENRRDWYRRNPYEAYWMDYAAGDPYYYSTKDRLGRLRIWTSTPEAGVRDVLDDVRRFSAFVQDAAAAGRLTLNVGLRFDYARQDEPGQSRPQLRYEARPPMLNPSITDPNALIIALSHQLSAMGRVSPWDELTTPDKQSVEFATLSPRLGLVYDIFGNGRTALKLSYARTYEPIWTAKYDGSQIFGPGAIDYVWHDLNANRLMDLPGPDAYVLTSCPERDPNYAFYPPDLKAPCLDEFLAGLEHEVFQDFKIGFGLIRKISRNIVEDWDHANGYDITAADAVGLIWLPFTLVDPGWDGQFQTTDDQDLTIYGLRKGRPAPVRQAGNPPEAERNYWAAVLGFDKRLSNNWQIKGSILYSSFRGNCDPGYGPTEGETAMFDNPNTLINAHGALSYDRPLQVKIIGTYVLPRDFIISAYAQYCSGRPWGRTLARVYFPADLHGFGTYSVFSAVNAESPGSRRDPPSVNLDLRLEKTLNLRRFAKLGFYLDIFNVLGRSGLNVNQDPAGSLRYDQTTASYAPSSTFGQIISLYGVRSFRLGARVSF